MIAVGRSEYLDARRSRRSETDFRVFSTTIVRLNMRNEMTGPEETLKNSQKDGASQSHRTVVTIVNIASMARF